MENRIKSIVVGVAELEDVDPHLKTAVELAEALRATLHVVHAYHAPDAALYPYPEMSYFSPETIERLRNEVQRHLETSVRRITTTARVECRTVSGTPELAVLDTVAQVGADLILTGATRRGRVARAILGTTAQRIIRGATVPVLLIKDGERSALRRVLFTTDLSELSWAAHEEGLDLVKALKAGEEPQIRSLLVVGYDAPLPPPLGDSAVAEVAEGKLEDFLANVLPPGPAVEGTVRVGAAADEIVAVAEEWRADLVVLGTHGRTGTSRFLIGSVAEAVLRSAPCDVLVIPNIGRSGERSPRGGSSAPVVEG